MKTIKEWFERVADPKLREELLANMKRPDETFTSLAGSIECGFSWKFTEQGWNYWNGICRRASNNQIELIDKPKIKKSDLDKKITELQLKHDLLKDVEIKELTKKIEDLEKIVNKMMSVKTEKTFKRNIELVWYINKTNGTPSMTNKKQADFESIKEVVYMGEHASIFKCKTKSSFEYLFYIGYYKD